MSAPGNEIIRVAQEWIGTPYRHQAALKGVGCDCLGLVRGVWQEVFGGAPLDIPPYSRVQRKGQDSCELLMAARKYLRVSQTCTALNGSVPHSLIPGQVLLFQLVGKAPPRHCGIVLSNNRFVHAQERLGVVEAHLDVRWARRVHSSYNFPEQV